MIMANYLSDILLLVCLFFSDSLRARHTTPECIEFSEHEVFIPSRLKPLKLCKDEWGFYVIENNGIHAIQNCDCDPLLQKMSNEQLLRFLGRDKQIRSYTQEEFNRRYPDATFKTPTNDEEEMLNQLLTSGYISVNAMDNGDYRLQSHIRVLGGGFWRTALFVTAGVAIGSAVAVGGIFLLAGSGGALVVTGGGAAATSAATAAATTAVGTTAAATAGSAAAGSAGIVFVTSTGQVIAGKALADGVGAAVISAIGITGASATTGGLVGNALAANSSTQSPNTSTVISAPTIIDTQKTTALRAVSAAAPTKVRQSIEKQTTSFTINTDTQKPKEDQPIHLPTKTDPPAPTVSTPSAPHEMPASETVSEELPPQLFLQEESA